METNDTSEFIPQEQLLEKLLVAYHAVEKCNLLMGEQLVNLAEHVKELDRRLTERENYSPIINELWAEQRLRALEEFARDFREKAENYERLKKAVHLMETAGT